MAQFLLVLKKTLRRIKALNLMQYTCHQKVSRNILLTYVLIILIQNTYTQYKYFFCHLKQHFDETPSAQHYINGPERKKKHFEDICEVNYVFTMVKYFCYCFQQHHVDFSDLFCGFVRSFSRFLR